MAAKKTEMPVTEATTTEATTIAEKKAKRKYEDSDLIPCTSITVGGLYMVGAKSKDLYEWLNYGETVEVEYRDLMSAIRSRDSFIFKPRFIIEDEEFLEQNPKVAEAYRGLFNTQKLSGILAMSPNSMKRAIEDLPSGAKDAIKRLAVTMINDGSLDSVQRIRVLDEIFGTEMLLSLAK